MRALACPASLKGVLTAAAAAGALAEGLRAAGADAVELPVADGGEGTAEALWLARGGEWREADVHDAFGAPRRARWLDLPDGTAVVESAAAVPLDPARLDPLAASSRGFGELVVAALADGAKRLVLGLGGTATMDAGAGFLELIDRLPVPASSRVTSRRRCSKPRACSGLRRAPIRRRSRRSSGRVRGARGACVYQTQGRLGRRGWAGRRARVARRRARSGGGVRARRGRVRRLDVRPRRHRRGARRRHDVAWKSARRGRSPRRRRLGASSSGASSTRRSKEPRPSRCPATRRRARDDLVALGRDLVTDRH